VQPGDGDLGDHGLHRAHLDGASRQDPVDLVEDALEDVLEADLLQQGAEQAGDGVAERTQADAVALAGRAKEAAQVEGQDLGEEMPRLLGARPAVAGLAAGEGEQPQLAQALEDHGAGLAAVEGVAHQAGQQGGRVLPVGSGEDAGGPEARRQPGERRHPVGIPQEPARQVQHRSQVARLGEGARVLEPVQGGRQLLLERRAPRSRRRLRRRRPRRLSARRHPRPPESAWAHT